MRTESTSSVECPACGYPNEPEDPACSLCGEVLARRRPAAPTPWIPRAPARAAPGDPSSEPSILGLPRPWFHLALGAPIALLLSWGPLGFAGWFLTSLVHELGHTVVAWFLGSPAYPAIRLDGHAAAFHFEQSTALALLVWSGLCAAAWWFREDRARLVVLSAAAAVYPLLAFTAAGEAAHLAAGHLAELGFAAVFFWRALTGGFVGQEAERPLYAALGWLWMGGSLLLFGSLVLNPETREWYLANGSFGLENDFVRMARLLGSSLTVAAAPMLLLSLLPLPVALLLGRRGTPARVRTSL